MFNDYNKKSNLIRQGMREGLFIDRNDPALEKCDPRRIPEMMDSRMIREDETAMANCPQQFIHREFKSGFVNPYDDNSAIEPVPYRGFKNHG